MKTLIISLVLLASLPVTGQTRERRELAQVNATAMTTELQRMANAFDGIHFIWWIPHEFWIASASQDGSSSDEDKEFMIKLMSDFTLLAVAQADLSGAGARFYDRETIAKGMKIEYSAGGKTRTLQPLDKYPNELRTLLTLMTPALSKMLGDLGQSLTFFVLSDQGDDGRLISPFEAGMVTVSLHTAAGSAVEPLSVELPLDSLYEPRLCPNGKPAHVTWVVCPWDGSKLPE